MSEMDASCLTFIWCLVEAEGDGRTGEGGGGGEEDADRIDHPRDETDETIPKWIPGRSSQSDEWMYDFTQRC